MKVAPLLLNSSGPGIRNARPRPWKPGMMEPVVLDSSWKGVLSVVFVKTSGTPQVVLDAKDTLKRSFRKLELLDMIQDCNNNIIPEF